MPVSKRPEFRVGKYYYKGDLAYSEEELGKAKPASIGSNWKWTCPFCAYANFPTAYICQRCGATKLLFIRENQWYVLERPTLYAELETKLAELEARASELEKAMNEIRELCLLEWVHEGDDNIVKMLRVFDRVEKSKEG